MDIYRSKTALGVLAGIVVALFVTIGGWLGLVWLLLFGTIGGVIGAQLDGRIDIAEIVSTGSGRGRS
ncbi:hypothetical protein SAMN04488535_1893 [Corynebacterium mycetoides]|uniref:Small integral membrane protein n=1 Tax=Corynebacterium mycetoides TaxID=38302 RepID=A0A1G9QEP8_9CORY|nr:hypothetical protein [Corynebacterium mycetoides]SDM09453.1 hypothetical protein SAMN04488535_1893 [Corynebacterium mycetoides]